MLPPGAGGGEWGDGLCEGGPVIEELCLPDISRATAALNSLLLNILKKKIED